MSLLASTSTRAFAYALFYIAPISDYFTTYHYAVHHVRGSSMAPALSPHYHEAHQGDWVLFRKNFRVTRDYKSEGGTGAKSVLERGMIVSFKNPVTGRRAVKRIVALQGDLVKPLRRPGRTVLGLEGYEEHDEVMVPFGHIWVEGDQVDREKSLDSNDYGPISKSLVEGVALSVIMPWSRRTPLDIGGDWKQRCRDRITIDTHDDEVPENWALA